MGKIGLINKLEGANKKKILTVLIVILVVAGLLWGGWKIFMGDTEVNFTVLNESEIPQQIATQVIPEYRQLERALACKVDDKIYVIATRGEKPTSGYEIAIDKMTIEEDDGRTILVVYAKFTDPQPGLALSQVLTYPLQVAETDLTDLPDQIQLKVQYVE
ncbi:MAG: protease complex subunit PrcB family protein [Clostridiales bacterium]|nr:protease complex subunit PrcB family protein [Clostridiales bacterium]